MADDCVYALQRLVDPALAYDYACYLELAQVKNMAEITAGTKKAADLWGLWGKAPPAN